MKPLKNVPASIHQRLLNTAKNANRPFNEIVQYYALERWLYRLAQSEYSDRFVLKGALMLLVWKTPVSRPTRDIDFLGRISNDPEAIRKVVARVCDVAVEDDGMVFDTSTITSERIAEDAEYEGVRVRFKAFLGKTTLPMQIDIGFSDVVTPEPVRIDYPTILAQPAPQLDAYNRETAIAEKFQAMVNLGTLNSRMKDFFDVMLLSREHDFSGDQLAEAIEHTFSKRSTDIDSSAVCFTNEFAEEPTKKAQWSAFLRRSLLKGTDIPNEFGEVVEHVRTFLQPIAVALTAKQAFELQWKAGGPWSNSASESF
jgi:predicted nucleotidyltransferase component of viral defense system